MLEADALGRQLGEHGPLGADRRLVRVLQGVVAVREDLGLDDRDETRLLAERGEPRERVRVDREAVVARQIKPDREEGSPLREPGPELPVLGEALAQAVKALGHRLAGCERERLRARVDLDAHDGPALLEQAGEREAVR